MKIKKHQLAYFAGFFDGEGSVSISKGKQNKGGRIIYRLSVSVSNSNNLPLLELSKIFGGWLFCRKVRVPSKLPSWQWQITGKKAEYFLKRIYPYVLIKKRPIEIGLKFSSGIRRKKMGGFKPLSTREISEKQELKEAIELANKSNWTGVN